MVSIPSQDVWTWHHPRKDPLGPDDPQVSSQTLLADCTACISRRLSAREWPYKNRRTGPGLTRSHVPIWIPQTIGFPIIFNCSFWDYLGSPILGSLGRILTHDVKHHVLTWRPGYPFLILGLSKQLRIYLLIHGLPMQRICFKDLFPNKSTTLNYTISHYTISIIYIYTYTYIIYIYYVIYYVYIYICVDICL